MGHRPIRRRIFVLYLFAGNVFLSLGNFGDFGNSVCLLLCLCGTERIGGVMLDLEKLKYRYLIAEYSSRENVTHADFFAMCEEIEMLRKELRLSRQWNVAPMIWRDPKKELPDEGEMVWVVLVHWKRIPGQSCEIYCGEMQWDKEHKTASVWNNYFTGSGCSAWQIVGDLPEVKAWLPLVEFKLPRWVYK